MFFLIQYKQYNTMYKYKYFAAYIIKHLSVNIPDIIVMNSINNKLCILNNTANSYEKFDLTETNNARFQSPYIYSYPTHYSVSLYHVQLYIKCILLSRYLNMAINLVPSGNGSTL